MNGVREYVGMRYLTKFADPIEWDVNTPYEHMTAVQYQGSSYISKKYVPVGIPITDTRYWLYWAAPNAQIELYRQEVLAFDGRITQAQSDADAAKDAADNAQESADAANAILSGYAEGETVKADITTLQSNINALDSKVGTLPSGQTSVVGYVESEVQTTDQRIDGIETQLSGAEPSGLRDMFYNLTDVLSGATVMPSYIGDFMANYQFASCCRVGNKIYAFSTDSWDGTGPARIFDMENNLLLSTKTIMLGHANSCAYDSVRHRIWIVPMSTYSAGVSTDTNAIYYYDESLSSMSTVEFPDETMLWSVSFDHVTRDLYVFTAYSGYGPIKVYRMRENEATFTLYTTIDDPALDTSITNTVYVLQDVAVRDGIAYVAKPEGTVLCFDMNNSNKLVWTFRIGMSDIGGIWKYGEIEGLEFDEIGHLYNARNALTGYSVSGAHHPVNCSFVTELNMPWSAHQSDMSRQTIYGTLTIDTSKVFRLGRDRIRSINQIMWRNMEGCSASISIPEGVTYEEDMIRIEQIGHLSIVVRGTMRINQAFYAFGCQLHIAVVGGTFTLDGSNGVDMESGACILTLRIRDGGVVTAANRFVHTAYSSNIVILEGLAEGQTLKIADVQRGNGMYVGSRPVAQW